MALLSRPLSGSVFLVNGAPGLNFPVRPRLAAGRPGMAATHPLGPYAPGLRSADSRSGVAGDLFGGICE